MLLHFIPGFITSDSTGSVLPAVWSSNSVSTGVVGTARQYLFVFLSKYLDGPVFTFGFCSMKRQGVGCMYSNSPVLCQAAPGSAVWNIWSKGLKSKVFWRRQGFGAHWKPRLVHITFFSLQLTTSWSSPLTQKLDPLTLAIALTRFTFSSKCLTWGRHVFYVQHVN